LNFLLDAKVLAQQPDSVDVQRELSLSYGKVGDALMAQTDQPAALTSYQAASLSRTAWQSPIRQCWLAARRGALVWGNRRGG
jgi:hypothetical protein